MAKVIRTFNMPGKIAQDIEKGIKQKYKFGVLDVVGFKRESTDISNTGAVLDYVISATFELNKEK